MTSESPPPSPPSGGIGGFFKRAWYAVLVILNGSFWNMYELFTPHRKFDVKSAIRRPGDNVVITGGARGIGKEVVRKLLQLDMHVIMGVRNETAAKAMVDEFRKGPTRITTGTVDILPLDLKSFKSVQAFATQVLQKYPKIHILINNAGLYDAPYEITEDGYEVTFQVNYLSHFLLTNMLLPKLTYAGTTDRPSRIVNLSSVAHYVGKLDLNDLWMEKTYGSSWAYGNAKLMQAISSRDFNDRLVKDGYPVRSFAVHPGVVSSGLYDNWPKIIRGLFWLTFKNNAQGADGVLYVALTHEIDKDAGKYFQNCSTFCTNSQVNNLEVQKKLWEASCKATGWTDSINTVKPKVAPTRKNTPAIIITKDSGAESISSAKSKVTKDDLEKEGDDVVTSSSDIKRESVASMISNISDTSSDSKSLSEATPNKIDVKVPDKAAAQVSIASSVDGGGEIPPSVGGSE